MKYSKKRYEEMCAKSGALYAQMMEAAKQAKKFKQAGIKELTNIIRANPNSTAEAISKLTEYEFSKNSIGNFGYNAMHAMTPTIPNLFRRENTKVRHFVEIDDNGNILPGTRKNIKSTYYTYSIK